MWLSGKTYGKLLAVKAAMNACFNKEATSITGQVGEDLTIRYMWKRLEHVLELAYQAEDIKAGLTPTEWEGFLHGPPICKGQPGYKKYSTLHEYSSILAWLPAGEDDDRYPKDPKQLQDAQEAFKTLEELCHAFRHMKEGKEAVKASTTATANKMLKKDSDGLALERCAFIPYTQTSQN